MKKLILGLALIAAVLTAAINFGNAVNSEEGIANIELSSLIAIAQADGESGGGTTNCYGGGTPWLGGTSLPKCETNCPYVRWKNPIKIGTCNF